MLLTMSNPMAGIMALIVNIYWSQQTIYAVIKKMFLVMLL